MLFLTKVLNMKRIFISLLILIFSPTLWANDTHLVIISDTLNHSRYQLILSNLLNNIPSSIPVTAYNMSSAKHALKDQQIPENAIVISMGIDSFGLLEKLENQNMLALLISEHRYQQSSIALKERASAIFINQPMRRITNVIEQLFKDVERIGIILSKEWPEKIDINHSPVNFLISRTENQADITRHFRETSVSSDLIIALPDPQIYNRRNIKNILLTTYKFKTPLIGYSEELSKAGALISIYTPGDLLGYEAAEWLNNDQKKFSSFSRYFTVKLNENVAQSLGKNLKNKALLNKHRWED